VRGVAYCDDRDQTASLKLRLLDLAGQPILASGAAWPLACQLLLGVNTAALGTVGSLPTHSCNR